MTRTSSRPTAKVRDFAAHFFLLGCVDFEDCLTLQRRLAYDALSRGDGRLVVLLCEHPAGITIGRRGSRAHVRLTGTELAERRIAVRYVGRGGGAILHGPGQLAVYPVVPLDWHRWSVGEFLRRFRAALAGALGNLRVPVRSPAGEYSLHGQGGVLAAIGVSVRQGVTNHGAFLNVNPSMRDVGRVEVAAGKCMSSILSERPLPIRMTAVRAAMVAHLAASFGCERHHLHTGHPLLAELAPSDERESAA